MKKFLIALMFMFLWCGINVSAVELPVLMYHSVDSTGGMYAVSAEKFEQDIISLINAGYTPVSLKQVEDYVYNGVELPLKPAVITLDDGYKNNYTTVLPIAEKYNAPVVVFSVAGFINTSDDAMVWSEAKAMNTSPYGQIGCHTYNLHVTPDRFGVVRNKGEDYRYWEHLFRNDLSIAKWLFTDYMGENPDVFAYPYGSFSAESEDILREEGYRVTVTTEPGVNIIEKGDYESLYLMLRISMDGKIESPVELINKYKNINTTKAIQRCKNNIHPNYYVSRGQALEKLYSKMFKNLKADFKYIEGYTDMKHASQGERELFAKCVGNNIIAGFPDWTMRPSHYITRGEFAVLLARRTGYDGRSATYIFSDASDWNSWALSWCAEMGYMIGYGESFGVNDFLTKEQIDIVCQRVGL